VLKNQIGLGLDQTQALVEFLTAWKNLLKRISMYDKEDAEEAIKKVYWLIAAYGRKVRERKGDSELTKNREPMVGNACFDPSRQLFHGLSGCPDLSCHIKTDQSLDPERQT